MLIDLGLIKKLEKYAKKYNYRGKEKRLNSKVALLFDLRILVKHYWM